MSEDSNDALGELIVAKGLEHNAYLLDLNRSLSVPRDFPLPAPWNLPSRMFRSPIEVREPEGERPRKIGLHHPLLTDHPFVKHVEAELGVRIDPNGAPNRYGYSSGPTARWWHAVDLISSGHWRGLLETQHFTEPANIMRAVAYGCRYSHHEDRKGAGYFDTVAARTIMREIGGTEPTDRSGTIRAFMEPLPCKQESGTDHWPINHGQMCAEDVAWGMILGIEDGWFKHDRAGHLIWSEYGRGRYRAGESQTYTEATGQAAFAF